MNGIHLIGTIHTDLRGTECLKRALSIEKPDVLTLESSKEGMDTIMQNYEADLTYISNVLRKLDIPFEQYNKIMKNINTGIPYEFEICKEYAEQTGIQLHQIDDPVNGNVSRSIISSLKETLEKMSPEEIIANLNVCMTNNYVNNLYQKIQNLYEGIVSIKEGEELIVNPCRGIVIGKRDDYEAKQLIALAKKHPGKIVHVGGAVHTLDDSKGETLYSKLKEFNPTRKTLRDY